jgi:hypothetical protein
VSGVFSVLGVFGSSGGHGDLERHFSGDSSAAVDRRLFRHMKTCTRCRDEYRTFAMLEALESGGGDRARERMGRGLFEAAPRRRVFVPLGAGLTAAVACAVLLVSVGRAPSPFRARGGVGATEATGPSLAVFRVPPDHDNPTLPAVAETQRAGNVVRAGESLAFSYTNPQAEGACCLMVFARDPAGHVYWFWPAWNDAAEDPTSLPISASPGPVELTEAVRHPLQPGELTIVGLFTPKPLHVREVEAAVAKGLDGLQAFEGHLWTDTLEVTP